MNRTFPKEAMFQDPEGYGQKGLKQILRAYAAWDRDVGYC